MILLLVSRFRIIHYHELILTLHNKMPNKVGSFTAICKRKMLVCIRFIFHSKNKRSSLYIHLHIIIYTKIFLVLTPIISCIHLIICEIRPLCFESTVLHEISLYCITLNLAHDFETKCSIIMTEEFLKSEYSS